MTSNPSPSQSRSVFFGVIVTLQFLVVFSSWSQTATNLAFLGTNSTPFEVDVEGGFTTAPFSQGSNTLTLNVPFDGGDQLYGAFGTLASPLSFDWSGVEALAFSLSASAPPPVLLNVEFWASDLSTLATATVGIGGIGSTPTTVVLDFDSGDITSLNDVAALFLSWGGESLSGDSAVTIHSIQAVPEPSTWALLGTAFAFFAYLGWRRRYRAQKN